MRKRVSFLAALCLTLAFLLPGGPAWSAEEGGRRGVLLVAFGTSVPEGMVSYEGIEKAFAAKGIPVAWAYTSTIIRDKLATQGKTIYSTGEALDALAAQGVKDVVVQSLHVFAGEEFTEMERLVLTDVLTHPGRFESVTIGRPLLESLRDADEVAEAVFASLPKDVKKDDAVLFMAHGQSRGIGDLALAGMESVLAETRPRTFMASVENGRGIERAVAAMRAQGVKRVWLLPLMVVAGDHARNDMAGDEPDSWTSRIKAAGMEPLPVLRGLGELPGVQAVFVRHALETEDELLY